MAATRAGNRPGAERVAFGGYDLLQLVAVTRLGAVHRGESNDASTPHAPLAIKWLKPEHSRIPAIAACFTDVMTRARRLEHAGFCAILEVDRAPDDSLFAALEWVSGKDWKRIVATLKKQGTTMPPTLVAYVGMRAAQALEAAHRPSANRQIAPLFHGELSGADILIGYDGRVKLSGLGSAELSAAARLPEVRTAFRAPELGRGAACSAQSDVFSLGACLYQALTLRAESPRHGSDLEAADKPQSAIRHIVPAALLEIVRKAVAEDPRERFGSAGELANALAHWASTQSSPGDARALSAFMMSLFEQTRSGPMNDPKESTPAQPLRARRLAAMTRTPMPEESIATTPAPVAPVREPLASVAKPNTPALAEQHAAAAEPIAAAAPAPAEPIAAAARPLAAPVPAPTEQSWDSEPWENAREAESAWNVVTPAAAPVITTRPPSALAGRAHSREPVATHAPVLAVQHVTPPLPTQVLPGEGLFDPHTASPREAWRVPAFVAASVLVLVGVLLALRTPEPAPEVRTPVAAPAVATAQHTEPVSPAPARPEPPTDPVPATGAGAHPAAPAVAPVAVKPTQLARAPIGDSEPRQTARPARLQPMTARSADTHTEPSAEPSARVESPEPAVPDEAWAPAARPAIAATPVAPTPQPAPLHAALAEPAAAAAPAPAPQSAPKPSVVRSAELISQQSPDFPTRAKRRGVTEGTVTVEYTVDETGAVRDPRVVESLPKGLFDEATLIALEHWRYRPKLIDGKPVTSRRSFTFHFQ